MEEERAREPSRAASGARAGERASEQQLGRPARLLEEHLELEAVGVLAVVGEQVVVARELRGDELGAGVGEELVEHRLLPHLHLHHLLPELLLERALDVVLEQLVRRAQREGHGEERHHLVRLLDDLLVLAALGQLLLVPAHVHQARVERADAVGVAAHHEVGEPDVVERGDVRPGHLGEEALPVEVDGVQRLEGAVVVPQEAVDAREADEGEVALRRGGVRAGQAG